jgi:hypothetical protein
MSAIRQRSASMLFVAVVLAFGITLALTWPRGAAEPHTRAGAASMPAVSRGSTPAPLSRAPPATEATPTAVAAARAQPAPNEAAPAPEAAAPSVPVQLTFQSRRLAADAQDPNRQGRKLVVHIINASREALPVEVLVTSSEQSVKLQLQMVLRPHQTQELGADAGAALESGDVITVKSPNFRDLVRPI